MEPTAPQSGLPEPPRRGRRRLRTVLAITTACLVLVAGAVLGLWLTRPGPNPSVLRPADPPTGEPRPTGSCTWLDPPPDTVATPVARPRYDPEVDGRSMLATIRTNLGIIRIELFGEQAPCTVSSFRHLAALGFYDHTDCGALVTGLSLLQCGDPTGTGRGYPGYAVPGENQAAVARPGSPRGTVGMAYPPGLAGPSGSQFFFVYADSPSLAPRYTVLGQVREGMEILDQVAGAGHHSTPSPDPGTGPPALRMVIEAVAVSPNPSSSG